MWGRAGHFGIKIFRNKFCALFPIHAFIHRLNPFVLTRNFGGEYPHAHPAPNFSKEGQQLHVPSHNSDAKSSSLVMLLNKGRQKGTGQSYHIYNIIYIYIYIYIRDYSILINILLFYWLFYVHILAKILNLGFSFNNSI